MSSASASAALSVTGPASKTLRSCWIHGRNAFTCAVVALGWWTS